MEETRSCELMRSLYDYLVLNPTSRPCSSQNDSGDSDRCLQSALLAFLINPDDSNESVMREQFQKILNSSSGNGDINGRVEYLLKLFSHD